MLSELVDPRDGTKVVERVIRVREDPHTKREIPPDLIVCWRRSRPFDTVDSPMLGRVGPLPFFRSGGHKQHGEQVTNVLFAHGPGLAAGAEVNQGHLRDVPATLLALIGAEPPMGMEGRPLFTPYENATMA